MLEGAGYPLLLSTLAGLSTALGGVAAIASKPNQAALACLLGVAIGVMTTVSVVELFVKNAMAHDPFLVAACAILGGVTYYIVEPLFPKFEENPKAPKAQKSLVTESSLWNRAGMMRKGGASPGARQIRPSELPRDPSGSSLEETSNQLEALDDASDAMTRSSRGPSTSSLLRLGLLMAVTMTLHNLPEGFAVAFSAYTDLGPTMAIAIAAHNIPEGIIIAAPIYAATGSRWKAVGLATLSGLSEPLGACIALAVLGPVLTAERLSYMLGAVGGVMVAVCYIELLPEARACQHDGWLIQGFIWGSAVMGWTLYLE